jgi:hypothetical protein
MTIRIHIGDDFTRMAVSIYVVDSIDQNRARVMQPEGSMWQWAEVDPSVGYEVPPTIRLPEDAARALLDSLAAHFGGVSEVQTLRKDYLAERSRVDKLTDALIRLADSWARPMSLPFVEAVADRPGYPR